MSSFFSDVCSETPTPQKKPGEKTPPKTNEWQWQFTPPKINIEPENDGLEDDFPFPGVYSQVPC